MYRKYPKYVIYRNRFPHNLNLYYIDKDVGDYKEIIKKMFRYFASSILTFRLNSFCYFCASRFMTGKSSVFDLNIVRLFVTIHGKSENSLE